MRSSLVTVALASFMMLVIVAPAAADFTGQTILGPLSSGSVVTDTTMGSTDDNDGITSGMHIFEIWNGPDDVWQIDWTGGDMALQMIYDNTVADLDLFLYTPSSYDDSGNFSILNTGVEDILEMGAAPGIYYVLVDSTDFSTAGAYTLSVIPEPATLALLGIGLALVVGRKR